MRIARFFMCFMGENALEHPFYRVFSLVSPSRAMKRLPGRPEPKMSWFYKGFSKEKCRFMKAFKTGFSRPGRGGQALDCRTLIMLSTPRTGGLRQAVGPPARPVRVSAEYLSERASE